MTFKRNHNDFFDEIEKVPTIFLYYFHNSTISSLSKSFSNFSNSSSRFSFVSINYIKLHGDLQPTLRSLTHFFLTNIIFLNFLFVNDIS
jgi:hypothetical protein